MENHRYINVIEAIYSGITSPSDIVNVKIGQKECKKYNPPPEDLLSEICGVLESRSNIKLTLLKADLGISRADLMTLYASFTDYHNIEKVNIFLPYVDGSVNLIQKINSEFGKNKSPLGISEQLNLALDLSGNDITSAVIHLSLATRMVARKSDNRILSVSLSKEDVFQWKLKLTPFGYGEICEDALGDTYHFWFAVFAGISREEESEFGAINKAKQFLCDFIYPNTASATEILRHKIYLGINSWNTHEIVDRLGYHVGRALVGLYGNNK